MLSANFSIIGAFVIMIWSCASVKDVCIDQNEKAVLDIISDFDMLKAQDSLVLCQILAFRPMGYEDCLPDPLAMAKRNFKESVLSEQRILMSNEKILISTNCEDHKRFMTSYFSPLINTYVDDIFYMQMLLRSYEQDIDALLLLQRTNGIYRIIGMPYCKLRYF